MTSIMASEGKAQWGERRAAERTARRKRRRVALITTGIALPLVAGIAAGIFYDPTQPPRAHAWLAHATAIAILAIGIFITWRNWQDADEMQRRHAIACWAVVGLANFILNPVSSVLAEQLNRPGLDGHSWGISLLIGLIYHLIKRARS